jgi:LacI family repressor for deo operon, udp, cdd, tsx, nupC, and nupG
MTTIQDVAKRASVSTATVSRVLTQPERVAKATRRRVLKAVEQLGYQPNRAARNLRTLKASKLLLSVPLISNPVFGDLIHGAEEAAREAGYAVILGETRLYAEQEDAYSAMLASREVDGILFTSPTLPRPLQQTIAKGEGRAPIVNACEFDPSFGVSSVHIDDRGAAEAAIGHLIELGHRRIGIVSGKSSAATTGQRLEGVKAMMARHDLASTLFIRDGDFSIERGMIAARELLQDDITAIFCFSDEMAIGALKGISEAGLSCPRDISLVGFDGIRFARYTDPPLTTIVQPSIEIGRTATRLLIDTINGRRTEITEVVLPYQLDVRGSTAPPPRR